MNTLSEFWFWFGAAMAAQGGSPIDLSRAGDGIDEDIATVSELAESQFLNGVLSYLHPYNEFHDAVARAALELYRDLTFTPSAEWEAAFDSGQIGG